MANDAVYIRRSAEIRRVDDLGYRVRRHLAGKGKLDGSQDESFGVLRVFDDVVINPRSNLLLDAHDGFEIVIYVLGGLCLIEDDLGGEQQLVPDSAALLVLGRGIRHDLTNRSSTEPLHLLMASVVAQTANPTPRSAVATFERSRKGIVWVASFDPAEQDAGALRLGASARIGIAKLNAGAGLEFPRAVSRGLYVNVLRGKIAVSSALVDQGGDARVSRNAPVRMEATARARVVVADVAMGPAPRVW
jgi:redox-sensitive bicupin YhaK (pirin superfamily)